MREGRLLDSRGLYRYLFLAKNCRWNNLVEMKLCKKYQEHQIFLFRYLHFFGWPLFTLTANRWKCFFINRILTYSAVFISTLFAIGLEGRRIISEYHWYSISKIFIMAGKALPGKLKYLVLLMLFGATHLQKAAVRGSTCISAAKKMSTCRERCRVGSAADNLAFFSIGERKENSFVECEFFLFHMTKFRKWSSQKKEIKQIHSRFFFETLSQVHWIVASSQLNAYMFQSGCIQFNYKFHD